MFQSRRLLSAAALLVSAILDPAASAQSQPAAASISAAEREAIATRLRNYFDQRVAARAFDGAVIVARGGQPLFQGAYGLADRETGEPNGLDTRFNMASLGKMLTQVAIMQLVQSGRLGLDDPVGRYLPDYPNQTVRDRVTVRHLYNMQSGVGSFWNSRFEARRASLRTIDDYLDLFATDPLAFEPGTSSLYSNGGYIILGKIIEVVSGLSYPDYVASNIAAPAGMRDTGFFALDERVPRRAIGYTAQTSVAHDAPAILQHGASAAGAPLRPNTDLLPGRGLSAGGGYASVTDFLRFDQALRSHVLLDSAHTALLLGPAFENGGAAGFAGGYAGVNTMFLMYGDGTTIIVFANRDAPAAVEAAAAVAEMLGEPLPVTRRRPPG